MGPYTSFVRAAVAVEVVAVAVVLPSSSSFRQRWQPERPARRQPTSHPIKN